MVLGCRDFNLPQVPPRSRFGNKTTSAIFKLFCGITLSDTQTGLRAIPRSAVEVFLQVSGDRFEYETNMLLAMKTQGIPFEEVKIRTVYIEENKSSHFHVIRDSWRIYKLILAQFFRYTLSSLSCAAVDTAAFAILDRLLVHAGQLVTRIVPFVGARVLSSLLNFYLNKKVVFQSQTNTGKAMLRYYLLAIPQMAAQILLTNGAFQLFHIGQSAAGLRTLWYVIVMICLYFLSYTIQRSWVFAPKKSK